VQGLWTLAHEVGYRQYFPHPAWEYVPKRAQASVLIDRAFDPRYVSRGFFYSYGALASNQAMYDRWMVRNRVAGGFEVDAGHAYGRISTFLLKGEPAGTLLAAKYPDFLERPDNPSIVEPYIKFCTSNPRLQDKVRGYVDAMMSVAKPPSTLSMAPSDGDGWGVCTCTDCPMLGSISNKAATLANVAADQLAAKYPGTYVGMTGYHSHSEPPTIPVRKNVIVAVSTSFINNSTMTMEERLRGWKAQGAEVGIRDYLSINTWDRDLPGWPQASSLDYVNSLEPWSKIGARIYSVEAGDNWGPAGLGYYLMSRGLWESVDPESVREEFLNAMFPEALGAMRPFYAYLYPPNTPSRVQAPPVITAAQIAQLYKHLADAYVTTKAPEAISRLDLLGLYARYVDLLFNLNAGNYLPRTWPIAKVEGLLQYTFRIRNAGMVHAYALHRDLPLRMTLPASILNAPWYLKNRLAGATIPAGMQDFTHDEILAWVQAGAK
jgi:hypothetical protein